MSTTMIEIEMTCNVCDEDFIAYTTTTRRCPDCRSVDRRPAKPVVKVRKGQKFHVEILGPNLRTAALDTNAATFHVHRVGCIDVRRDPKGYGYNQYEGHEWRMKARTLTEVCDAVYPPGDFNCESGEYLFDFKVFPCCSDLPD